MEVRRAVLLPTPLETVWAALTDAGRLSAWLGSDVDLEPFPGGQIVVNEDGRIRRGVIVDMEPLRHLEIRWLPASRRMGFLWGPDDEPAGTGGDVEFVLAPVPGERRLHLSHGGRTGPRSVVRTPCGAGGGVTAMDREPENANVFEALADPTRREVMRRLAEGGPATATELAGDLPVTRQAVAKHLATLAEAGLVTSDRQGRETLFSFTPEPLADAVTWMADVGAQWDDRLQALSQYLETGEPRPKRRRAGFDTDR